MAKFFLAALLILLLGAGAFWYWTTTPQYAVAKIAESIHNHDGETFRYYFDVDNVSRHAVDDLMSNGAQKIAGRGLLQRLIGVTVAGLFKPELAQILGRNITDYVEKVPEKKADSTSSQGSAGGSPNSADGSQSSGEASTSDSSDGSEPTSDEPRKKPGRIRQALGGFFKTLVDAIKPPSLREVLHEMGLNKQNYKGLTPFETSGSICHVGLRFQPPQKDEIQVQVELENTKDHWRVVRFSNLEALAKSVSGI